MIVDDDEEDIYLAKRAFKACREDIKLVSVSSGALLFDYLSGTGSYEGVETEQPCIILMDINMPIQNGFDVVRALKKHAEFSHIPVIMLTTSDAEHDVNKAYAAGANSYLCKSVNANEMKNITLRICDFWLDLAKLPKAA